MFGVVLLPNRHLARLCFLSGAANCLARPPNCPARSLAATRAAHASAFFSCVGKSMSVDPICKETHLYIRYKRQKFCEIRLLLIAKCYQFSLGPEEMFTRSLKFDLTSLTVILLYREYLRSVHKPTFIPSDAQG